jgi:polyhydroxyalkanoic acid synthase PhaR subunit
MTQGPFDPLALWRDMLAKWETGVNDLSNKSMGSPEFSQFMNQAMGMSVRMQHAVGDMMGKYLTAMNMPTRADLVAIGERLQSIEDQLARISTAIERASSVESKTYDGPPRTKRPPAQLNGPVPDVAPAVVQTRRATAAVAAPAAKAARRAKKKSKAS